MKLALVSNHALALTATAILLACGYSEQSEIAGRLRRCKKGDGLIARPIHSIKGVIGIVTGGDHSFAVHENGLVYALGLDYYAQRGAIEKKREQLYQFASPRSSEEHRRPC